MHKKSKINNDMFETLVVIVQITRTGNNVKIILLPKNTLCITCRCHWMEPLCRDSLPTDGTRPVLAFAHYYSFVKHNIGIIVEWKKEFKTVVYALNENLNLSIKINRSCTLGPGGSENFETYLAEKMVPRVVNVIYFDKVFDCSSREWSVQKEAMNSSITKNIRQIPQKS